LVNIHVGLIIKLQFIESLLLQLTDRINGVCLHRAHEHFMLCWQQ